MMRYLVFQVGCIECGVSSYPIKVCSTLEEAQAAADDHPSTWESEGGDGFVTIIDLKTCQNVSGDTEMTHDEALAAMEASHD